LAAPQPDTRAFLNISHELAQWMIQLADTKASILTAASAILAGLLSQQSVPACYVQARYVLLLAIGLALSTAGACLLTLYPRTTPERHSSLLYFLEVIRFAKPSDYLIRVQGQTAVDTDRELAQQVWELAHTQDKKYKWLRWAVKIFGLCLIIALIGVTMTRLPCP
jgi:hypothetical protein